LGIASNGIVDIGFNYQRSKSDEQDDLIANFYGASLTIHFLKLSEKTAVSFSLSGSYLLGGYSSDYLDRYNIKMGGTILGLGGNIAWVMNKGANTEIMPPIGITSAEITIDHGSRAYGDEEDSSDPRSST
jgi:hypothetical protein